METEKQITRQSLRPLAEIGQELKESREILKGIYEELVLMRGHQDERAEQLRKPPWQFSKSQKICERRYV